MKRLFITIAMCTCWLGLSGIAGARIPEVKAAHSPAASSTDSLPPVPPPASPSDLPVYAPAGSQRFAPASQPASPGEAWMSREARAHEQHLMQSQAAAESIRRAAMARAEQRTRRLESQRWFGISNTRPTAGIDPYDGDYSPGWVSNYPYYPNRWVGGESWGFVEAQ